MVLTSILVRNASSSTVSEILIGDPFVIQIFCLAFLKYVISFYKYISCKRRSNFVYNVVVNSA